MNDLPKNQNEQELEETSTVFSNPQEHEHKETKNQNKKRLKIIISSVLAVAVLLGGTFAVIKLIPEKEDPTAPTLEEIPVLDIKTDDIKEVTLKNKNGTFKLSSKQTKEDDQTTTLWLLDGYDAELTDSYSIENIVSNVASVSAIREITSKSSKDCGLENPVVKAVIKTKDKNITLDVGSKSPDNSGVYVKSSTDNKIYLVADTLDETLTFTALDMANTDTIPALDISEKYSEYYEEETLSSFDSLTVTGVNFPEKLVIVPSDEEMSQFLPYTVTSPMKRSAENVDGIFDIFKTGITVIGAYSFDVSAKTLGDLKLNNPDFAITAKFGNYEHTYKFKKQSDGDYAVVGTDSKMVKKVALSDCPFLEYKASNFYASFVFLESIDTVSNLTIKDGDKTYSFDIKANPDEEDEDNKYIIDYNGKKIKSSNFQSFYQLFVSLSSTDFTVDNLNEKPEVSIIVKYNDKKPTNTIEFVKANATNYQYSIDGVKMGRISSSQVKKLLKNVEKLISGEEVIVN